MINWPPRLKTTIQARKMHEVLSKTISTNIRERRLKLGLTQAEFANRIGNKQSAVARDERISYGTYSLYRLTIIAAALETTVIGLLTPNQRKED